MTVRYEARWVTKERIQMLRKQKALGPALVLDSMRGFLIVEPAGSGLGDGAILSLDEADYELAPALCPGPLSQLREARRRLTLADQPGQTHHPLVG